MKIYAPTYPQILWKSLGFEEFSKKPFFSTSCCALLNFIMSNNS